ncbi:MAG: type II toxin-antitoxin system VapB family antitoxin [Actinomycetota bacterium]
MVKHLIDIDDDVLSAAQVELGTKTIKATVNEALRRTLHERESKVAKAFETLANMKFVDREEAWR